MPTMKVYNMGGQVTGEVQLSDAVFGIEPNAQAIHELVKNHLANTRQGTQSALTRAEVSGGGIKPYRQKGTGRARQGSTRAPQHKHGGVAFAPKPRDYSYTINKKLRKLALKSALSQKVLDKAIVVVDSIELQNVKTQDFAKFLKAVGVSGKALVVTPEVRDTVVLSARNIPGIQTTIASILSVYDVMNAKAFIVDKAALQTIEEVYA
jgi:large subunit ribosomal protein L4